MSDDSEDNVDRELFRNIEKLRQLRIEHRDLDQIIARLALDIHVDEVQMRRLKKRKLLLKDQIARAGEPVHPGSQCLSLPSRTGSTAWPTWFPLRGSGARFHRSAAGQGRVHRMDPAEGLVVITVFLLVATLWRVSSTGA